MSVPNLNTFAPQQANAVVDLPVVKSGSSIAVIGAGAFGCWTAIELARRNYDVTLFDAWGAGNSLSSSGDETRVIRSTYGANEFYFDLNVRAGTLWRAFERVTGQKIFFTPGVLWFCYHQDTPLVDDSIPFAEKHGQRYEYISRKTLEQEFPMISSEDLHHAWYDPFGGYLLARNATQMAKEYFVAQGGKFCNERIRPGKILEGRMRDVLAANGKPFHHDAYVFACGAWLGKLFPVWLEGIITCTRQEVFYFGVPPGLSDVYENIPVWVDVDGHDFYYGIPNNGGRGFKVGVDRRGRKFDPESDDRVLDEQVLEHARSFLGRRFPGLKDAPLVEHRVCPYESSPDGNFIFDVHPQAKNVYVVGGGSGHGFKHSPAFGELVADVISGKKNAPGMLALRRLHQDKSFLQPG